MQDVFPAHHRKIIARLLRAAKADLAKRLIGTDGKSALQIFALRAAERHKNRNQAATKKALRRG
jgi:hypothetical protein